MSVLLVQPGGITDLDMYDDYLHEYPYLSLNWEKLCDRHGVSFIIVDKAAQAKFLDRYNFSSLRHLLRMNLHFTNTIK